MKLSSRIVIALASLNRIEKILYGSCRFGTSMLINILSLALFWIYTNHFNLPPILNGVGNAVGKIVIALSGFFFGFLSDFFSLKRKIGRKIFILIGAPMLALSFIMLFIPQYFISIDSSIIVFVWLLFWNALFNLFYGFLLTPYQAWLPDIANENERVHISQIQNTSSLVGTLASAGFSFYIAGALEQSGGIMGEVGTNLLIFVLVFAIIEVLFFIPTLVKIPEPRVKNEHRKLIHEIKEILSNKNYVIFFLAQGLFSIPSVIISSLILDFLGSILDFKTPLQFISYAIANFGALVLSFFFWRKISQKIGVKKSLLSGYIIFMIVVPFTYLLGIIPSKIAVILAYIFGFLLGSSASTYFLFGYSILADIADVDKRTSNKNRSGLYYGFNYIPVNIFQALAYLIVGFLRDLGDIGLLIMGPISALFALFAIPILLKGNFDPFDRAQN